MVGGPQGQSGWVWKILPPPGFYPRTIQLPVTGYTDYNILTHLFSTKYMIVILY
jgi:hypothetical protein